MDCFGTIDGMARSPIEPIISGASDAKNSTRGWVSITRVMLAARVANTSSTTGRSSDWDLPPGAVHELGADNLGDTRVHPDHHALQPS